MMDGILDEAEDDSLPSPEKMACQKLLLTISMKERMFNDEQRLLARSLLKRLEGDRRRRCRTSTEQGSRFSNRGRQPIEVKDNSAIHEQLRIVSSKQRKKRRKNAKDKGPDDTPTPKRKKRGVDALDSIAAEAIDEDGYLQHSDSEGDWSDVAGGDIYQAKKKPGISKKEARRRRQWAHDDDAVTAAGRPWPAFPRIVVNKVLATVLDEVIKDDKKKGGIFSEPVPKDAYPEYYEQIKQPMDYGTMKLKLERGEYRSAQAMQKDFVLVMQNCIKFNAPGSDVVREAREQALKRPSVLRNAALQHNLFLAEDGSVLDVLSDSEKEKKSEEGGKKKRGGGRRKKGADAAAGDDADAGTATTDAKAKRTIQRKRGKKKEPEKVEKDGDGTETENENDDDETFHEDDAIPPGTGADPRTSSTKAKKPRIRISVAAMDGDADAKPAKKKSRKRRKKSDASDDAEAIGDDIGDESDDEPIVTAIPKRKRKKTDDGTDGTKKTPTKAKRGRPSAASKAAKALLAKEAAGMDDAVPKATAGSNGNTGKGKSIPSGGKQKSKGGRGSSGKGTDGDSVTTPAKKKKAAAAAASSAKSAAAAADKKRLPASAPSNAPLIDNNDPASIFLRPDVLKKERDHLKKKDFDESRNHMVHRPWTLPVILSESFTEVAKAVLTKMSRHDTYSVFAEAVTEEEAPGYYEIISQPMDMSTMWTKVDKGSYGRGVEAARAFYDDFLLMFDNCYKFNDEDGEVVEEAARLFALLPETFATACLTVAKKIHSKK